LEQVKEESYPTARWRGPHRAEAREEASSVAW